MVFYHLFLSEPFPKTHYIVLVLINLDVLHASTLSTAPLFLEKCTSQVQSDVFRTAREAHFYYNNLAFGDDEQQIRGN